MLKASENSSFPEQVAKRFRLVPNFFVSAPDAPEIVERLWAFAAGIHQVGEAAMSTAPTVQLAG